MRVQRDAHEFMLELSQAVPELQPIFGGVLQEELGLWPEEIVDNEKVDNEFFGNFS